MNKKDNCWNVIGNQEMITNKKKHAEIPYLKQKKKKFMAFQEHLYKFKDFQSLELFGVFIQAHLRTFKFVCIL